MEEQAGRWHVVLKESEVSDDDPVSCRIDGVEIAIAALNAKGGLNGHKVELVVEDNRSEPQDAVTAYRKMISSDNVDVFASGCVSAGNFAAAPLVVRAQKPMVLCSILPQQADAVKWAFTTIPPPRFEVGYFGTHTNRVLLQFRGIGNILGWRNLGCRISC